MTDADKKRFATALGVLGEIFGQEMSRPKLALYFGALRDLTIEQVEAAAEQLAGTVRFFPMPVDFREVIEGSAQDRAAVAWRTFASLCQAEGAYPSLQVVDGALAFAIEELGGWLQAQQRLSVASPEMERAHQKNFEQFYKIGQVRGARPAYFVGTDEAHNRGVSPAIKLGPDGRPVEVREIPQKVCLVGTEKYFALKMPFDLRAGQLAVAAREALAAGGEAIRRYLPAPPPKQLAPGPATAEEMATPEEIREIHHAVDALAGGRRLTRRLLGAGPVPTETDTVQ